MKLVLLSFGARLENHYQAAFAILSFMKSPEISGIYIVTDRPEFYRYFAEHVQIVAINAETLQAWQGESGFFWRVKIKAIEHVVNMVDDHVLYIDSDTFLVGDLRSISATLNQGQALMHLAEGKLSQLASKTERSMWSSLKGKTFQGVTINSDAVMWNAGVIGLPMASSKKIIQLALDMCDELCATNCTRRLIEQFSFSLAAQTVAGLQPCNADILHYWGNKPEWNSAIKIFFTETLLLKQTLSEVVDQAAGFKYQSLPIIRKERSTQRRLVKWVERAFPPKQIAYFD